MCPICKGRGEVEAGITHGTVEYGPILMGYDWKGNLAPTRSAYPTKVAPNPSALIYSKLLKKHEYWLLEVNPLCELWGIAICGRCRGSGLVNDNLTN